jgi:hypothetical protein
MVLIELFHSVFNVCYCACSHKLHAICIFQQSQFQITKIHFGHVLRYLYFNTNELLLEEALSGIETWMESCGKRG